MLYNTRFKAREIGERNRVYKQTKLTKKKRKGAQKKKIN